MISTRYILMNSGYQIISDPVEYEKFNVTDPIVSAKLTRSEPAEPDKRIIKRSSVIHRIMVQSIGSDPIIEFYRILRSSDGFRPPQLHLGSGGANKLKQEECIWENGGKVWLNALALLFRRSKLSRSIVIFLFQVDMRKNGVAIGRKKILQDAAALSNRNVFSFRSEKFLNLFRRRRRPQ
jgi:hypothetical protein